MKNDCPDGADEKKGLEGKPCGEKVVFDYGIFKHLNYFKTQWFIQALFVHRSAVEKLNL